jgi:NitT/TauT family transport system ATP-binding protein
MSANAFRLDGVSHSFGAVTVLDNLSLEIRRGEFVAIVGPSGCGKTTLLNLLSGHYRPSLGERECRGRIRMVYQRDSLFPWRTAAENILLGLRHIPSNTRCQAQLHELIDLIHLNGFENHYPHQLSGGMRQRVELARAIAGDSDTLLMDEPFSSLDYLERLRMRHELARILDECPRTVVLVTHDIVEATQLADRVLVLSERPAQIRRELQIGSPRPRHVTDPGVVKAAGIILAELGIEGETQKIAEPAER